MNTLQESIKRRPKIMIVDDDALLLRAVSMVLEEGGFDSVACSDGPKAMQLAETEEIDLILLDVVMPAMSGIEVCKKIKESAKGRRIPVVFLSGQGHSKDVVLGLEAGADGYLSKPIDPEVLLARVRALLRFQAAQQNEGDATTPNFQELLQERIAKLSSTKGLSKREQEVLQLLLLGRNSQDIGLVLGITPRTAKFHQANILAKLGAESRFDLIRLIL